MLFWLFVLVLLAAVGIAGFLGYRFYVTGETGINLGGWFAPRPIPRLGVSEQAAVDSRRRLVLVRRDDVEHLIMTGGPVDVVIETNIAAARTNGAAREGEANGRLEPAPPVFTRQPRTFGQAVNE
jgi:flagellar protein FliO/FliZ